MLRRQGWRARNSIQGDGDGNGVVMARPTPMTTFDVVAGAASDVGSERMTRGQDDGTTRGDATTRRAMRGREGITVRGQQEDESAA